MPREPFAGANKFFTQGGKAIKDAAPPVAEVLTVANVEREEIDWLWSGRIAAGKVTLIAGDPGLGKSMLTCALATHVSTGSPWPVDRTECHAGDVIMLSAEDDIGDTIRPRLEASGADLSRVHVLTLIREYRDGKPVERGFSVARDLPLLEAELRRRPATRLVTIDPVSAFLESLDSHNNAEVRGALAPLARLASKHHVAVVCVTHLNKAQAQSAMYRTTGSLAFVAAARAVFIVTKDQDDPSRRLFLPLKNNIAPDQSGLAFSIAQHENGSPYLLWEPDPVSLTVHEALSGGDEDRSERQDAKDWLMAELASGPVRAKDLKRAAIEAGHAWRTIMRAKSDLKIESKKESFGGEWRWHPPKNATTPKECHSQTVAPFGKVGILGGNYEPGADG